MKKLYLLIYVITIFLLTSCGLISDVKRISPEETEIHFNDYLADIETCIKENNIDDKYFDYFYEEDSGVIHFDFNENESDISLFIYLTNDRSNPFGNDYELGLEKYRITYQRMFSNEYDILNVDNSAFKIIPVVLSNITKDTITEEDIKEHFLKCKDKIGIQNYDSTENNSTLINVDCNFNNVKTEYSLGYYENQEKNYVEGIVFGGFHNNSYTALD